LSGGRAAARAAPPPQRVAGAPRLAALAAWSLLALALGACEPRERRGAEAAPEASAEVPLERLEILTGGARADDALPAVVAIHGLGDTPRGLAPLFEGFPLPARVVLPRAPTPYAGGGSWFPLPWDPGGEAGFERGVAAAAARLSALLDGLPGERPTRGRPVVTGFSQGGILAFAVATARPDLVSAALPIAGMLPRGLWPRALPRGAEAVPLRALHGDRDDRLPSAAAEALVAHLRRLGFDAELRLYPGTGHAVSREMLRDYHGLLADALLRAGAEAP
jgi:phospholipase/carboxylesterase